MTQEADSMSAMRYRMRKADKALQMEMIFHKNKGIAEGRKHKRKNEVVQACILLRAEAGTRRWWTLCMAGKPEFSIS